MCFYSVSVSVLNHKYNMYKIDKRRPKIYTSMKWLYGLIIKCRKQNKNNTSLPRINNQEL